MEISPKRRWNWPLLCIHFWGAWLLTLSFRQLYYAWHLELNANWPTYSLSDTENALEYLYQRSQQEPREELLQSFFSGMIIFSLAGLGLAAVLSFVQARGSTKAVLHTVVLVLITLVFLMLAAFEPLEFIYKGPAYALGLFLQWAGASQHYFIKGAVLLTFGLIIFFSRKGTSLNS